ncbi:MAG: PAS domain S-box protein [Deltaproteobacteria bacterium]|nr:PAS domain S-box protein [Deltaproteobacteria bacterium]
MPAVSCQLSDWMLEHIERVGLSAARLVDALPVGDEALRDPSRRLEWDHFITLCEQLEALLGGRDALRSAAQAFASARLADDAANRSARLTHSRQAYWLVAHWLAPSLLPGLAWSFADLDDGHLELTLEIPSAERPCPQLFALMAGALEAVPRLLRQPTARVEVDASERRAVFRIAPKSEEQRDELRESERRYRAIAESSRDVIIELSRQGELLHVTPNAREILGLAPQDLLGPHQARWIHPDDRVDVRERVTKMLETGDSEHLTFRVQHPDGGWRFLDTTGTAYRTSDGETRGILVSRDVTAQRQAKEALRESQEQLLHAQKMEAIGRLAGGVAHDFNNLLTAITGYSSLLIESLGADNPLRADVDEIVRAADQAASFTKQLLAFSRRQVLQPRVIDVNELVSNVDRLLRRVIGEDIDFVTSLDSELWPVKADPGQIEQLIMNLAVNARDAMPRGGRLVLATSTLHVPEGGGSAHPSIPAGDWVGLSLQDRGLGMSAQTLEHIFEPFFTTKETGKGTGLGLATVSAIVEQSGGHVRVKSEPGEGSTFSIYLPRTTGRPDETMAQPLLSDLRGTETLLLVEDSESVRRLLRRYLERHGYTVIEASSGVDALRAMKRHDGPLDLLVADVVLPKMDGRALARQLERERPGLRVLYMSGFSDDALSDHDVFDHEVTLLQKPFTPPELLRQIRTVLVSPPLESERDA